MFRKTKGFLHLGIGDVIYFHKMHIEKVDRWRKWRNWKIETDIDYVYSSNPKKKPNVCLCLWFKFTCNMYHIIIRFPFGKLFMGKENLDRWRKRDDIEKMWQDYYNGKEVTPLREQDYAI